MSAISELVFCKDYQLDWDQDIRGLADLAQPLLLLLAGLACRLVHGELDLSSHLASMSVTRFLCEGETGCDCARNIDISVSLTDN